MIKNRQCLMQLVLMLVLGIFVVLPAFAGDEYTAVYGTGNHTFSLAAGSPGELGLLKVSADVFNPKHDTRLCWRKAGSDKSLELLNLKQANEQNGYFMTDSSMWVAAKKEMNNIKILFRGDPFRINTYHTLCQPEGTTAGQPYAAKFTVKGCIMMLPTPGNTTTDTNR